MRRLSQSVSFSLSIACICAAVLLSGCDLFGSSNDSDGYPSVLEPLPEAELESRRRAFVGLHQGSICTGLNRFGLTGGGVCTTEADSVAIADTMRVKQIVRDQLTRYASFTNVDNAADIRFRDIDALRSDTEWRVILADQRYDGHRVLNSSIYVFLTGSGVYRINGHWYDDILIPANDTYTPEDVKEDLVEQTIMYYDFGGRERTFVITPESIGEETEKVIVPVEQDGRMELHVTWQVAIGQAGALSWYLYVDTTTGTRVHEVQLFET